MIIESLIAHILGSFYFRSYQKSKKTTNYFWGVLFTYITIILLNDGISYLEWTVLSLGLLVWHSLFDHLVQPILYQFFNRLESHTEHPIYELYKTNKNSLLFIIHHILYILMIFVLQASIDIFEDTALIFLSMLFIVYLLAFSIQRKALSRWKQRVYEGAVLLFITSVTVFVSQLILRGLELIHPLSFFLGLSILHSPYAVWVRGVLILLILLRPTNLLIRKISSKYDPKVLQKASIEDHEIKTVNYKQESGIKGAGAMIGNLERILILVSFFFGSLLSVVAILSIKAFARYKLIADDPYFSEYFVIGTMLSVLITFACYILFVLLLI